MSEVFRCPQCHSTQCVATDSKGEQIGLVSGALLGAACVTWGVFSPAAGALVVTSMLSSKVGRFGTMASGIFCGAEAGRTIGRCYDQAGSRKLTCRVCGVTFSTL